MARSKAVMVAQIKTQMNQAKDTADPAKKTRRKLKKSRERHVRKQIRINQAAGRFRIPKEPVKRLIRELATSFNSDILFSSQAFELLQAASEEVITEVLKDANDIATKIGKRATVLPQDVKTAARIRSRTEQRFYGK